MNRYERDFSSRQQAQLVYYDNDYQVKVPGDYVRCAATGDAIPLEQLRYWSVEYQEAYSSAEASLKRHVEIAKQSV